MLVPPWLHLLCSLCWPPWTYHVQWFFCTLALAIFLCLECPGIQALFHCNFFTSAYLFVLASFLDSCSSLMQNGCQSNEAICFFLNILAKRACYFLQAWKESPTFIMTGPLMNQFLWPGEYYMLNSVGWGYLQWNSVARGMYHSDWLRLMRAPTWRWCCSQFHTHQMVARKRTTMSTAESNLNIPIENL